MELKISSNLKIVNFLDFTFNLSNYSYKSFSKSNALPTYINVSSNHPASIVKQIPNAINIEINRLSSSKTYLIIIRNFIMMLYIIVVIKIN